MVSLIGLLLQIVVTAIVVSPSLWLAGRMIVGGKKAKFTDAILIVMLGVLAGSVVGYFIPGILAVIVQLVAWLWLVKHFFDANWGQAIAVAIIAVIIFVVVSIVLGLLIGVALFAIF